MIEELYYRGNEIAVNSVTGRNLQYENASIWREEIEGQRNLLGELANIPAKDILGVRAESLKPGFNKQFEVSPFFKNYVLIFTRPLGFTQQFEV